LIPLVILEEHHEAFIVWHHARGLGTLPRHGNVLFHVDSHADMGVPMVNSDLRQVPEELEALRRFAYRELGIGNFIPASLYLGLFEHFLWVQHDKPMDEAVLMHICSLRGEGRELVLTKNAHLAGVFNPDRRHYWYRQQTLEQAPPSAESFVLDIDLDYFSCDDVALRYRLEITAEEAGRVQSDPYHVLRLHYGNQVSVFSENDRHYLAIQARNPPLMRCQPESEAVIEKRLTALADYLIDHRIKPRLITVCRSLRSGYTPGSQGAFIEQQLLEQLRRLDRLHTMHISELVPGNPSRN
jgi:hypothetical protein